MSVGPRSASAGGGRRAMVIEYRCPNGGCVATDGLFVRNLKVYEGDLVTASGEFIKCRYSEVDECLSVTCNECDEEALELIDMEGGVQ